MNGFDDTQTVIFKLGQIESKLDLIAESISSHIQQDDKLHAESDKRVASLERSRAWALGAVAVISASVSVISQRLGLT